MLIDAVSRAVRQVFSPPFRSVLWKSLGITLALLAGLWFGMQGLMSWFADPLLASWPWASTALAWLLGAGLLIGMGFLIAPVTSLFAGIFLDDVAAEVERLHYPDDPPGKPLPVLTSTAIALRFLGLVILGNLLALLLVIFIGLGVIIFFVVNGYLLGREYFQFAAMRHGNLQQVEALRQRHSTTIFLAGLMIAALLSVPIANLLTPLFAGALMTHVYKAVVRSERFPDPASDIGARAA